MTSTKQILRHRVHVRAKTCFVFFLTKINDNFYYVYCVLVMYYCKCVKREIHYQVF